MAVRLVEWILVAVGGSLLSVADEVRDHYRKRWGEPARRAAFQVGPHEIEVSKWGAEATSEGVDLYATLGSSSMTLPGEDTGHRQEYFIGLRPAQDDVASPLAALGLYPHREGVVLDHGATVPGDGPLWTGTGMNAFLVVRQIGEILPALPLAVGGHVEFMQVVPIFDSERRYKRDHGVDALLRRWERSGTPFWDPGRAAEPAT